MSLVDTREDTDTTSLPKLVEELGISPRQIMAVAQLLRDGNTIPFIARYRKEAHGNLDEVQIARIQERLAYHRELDDRRQTILKSIEEQGKLTGDLKARIFACETKSALEDLYLPFRPKRRTRAMIARERGLEPLAERILAQPPDGTPEQDAAPFVNAEKGVESVAAALAGARDIVAERIAEDAGVRGLVRAAFLNQGEVVSTAVEPRTGQPTKFEQYYDYRERVTAIPSHRYLAIRRGQAEGVLRVQIAAASEPLLEAIAAGQGLNAASPFADHLRLAIEDAYKRLIVPSVEIDVAVELKLKADRAAVEVFAQNLRSLLLAPPLGERRVIGIDPGLRTGCKCAVLDATGKFLDTVTIYPSQGERAAIEASVEICRLVHKHKPEAIAVGNGTGGRETEAFVRETLKKAGVKDVMVVSVNESGASVYSASEVAREEFPDLDLTIRGAISIGRRLLDPLAELVKIDPKSIGVGQYQHDVHQPMLVDKLDEVVVSCVNRVGVELNTASAPLLARVAGIGPAMARRIVAFRDAEGAFKRRRDLLKVPALGPKTFEQAAGFLRIRGGEHPLDSSGVHPERYALVERMASDLGVELAVLVGNGPMVDRIELGRYVSGAVGEPTLKDITSELKKPGRDPRAAFEKPKFLDDVTEIGHVKPGMQIEGVVTNVTAFGAFVDIGVHQDGLVHVSELADRFIRDPSEVVKAGDKLKVRVLSVDLERKRIALSAKAHPGAPHAAGASNGRASQGRVTRRPEGPPPPRRSGFSANPFADL
ncbi:MAG: Tex family protein [Kiritimatiellae bacterium]|nr:Tex family protein [Kiritimatiellia bacterium]